MWRRPARRRRRAGCASCSRILPGRLHELEELLRNENAIWKARTVDVGYLDLTGCMALGITGPILRSTGLPHDLRKSEPYCGYENYEFDVITDDRCDCYGRYIIRVKEMWESLKIVEQCLDKLTPGPAMIEDKNRLARRPDGRARRDGQLPGAHRQDHGRLDGRPDPPLQAGHRGHSAFRPARSTSRSNHPAASSACTWSATAAPGPYRVHYRDPSFTNLQAVAAMCEGGMVADVITAVASIDPVMGGVDR